MLIFAGVVVALFTYDEVRRSDVGYPRHQPLSGYVNYEMKDTHALCKYLYKMETVQSIRVTPSGKHSFLVWCQDMEYKTGRYVDGPWVLYCHRRSLRDGYGVCVDEYEEEEEQPNVFWATIHSLTGYDVCSDFSYK